MTIENRDDVAEAIDAICDWIGQEIATEEVSKRRWDREPNVAGFIRDQCEILLAESMAEGMGGCPLCQG